MIVHGVLSRFNHSTFGTEKLSISGTSVFECGAWCIRHDLGSKKRQWFMLSVVAISIFSYRRGSDSMDPKKGLGWRGL